jgi:hypothetical protein
LPSKIRRQKRKSQSHRQRKRLLPKRQKATRKQNKNKNKQQIKREIWGAVALKFSLFLFLSKKDRDITKQRCTKPLWVFFGIFPLKSSKKMGSRAKSPVPHSFTCYILFISVVTAANKQNCDSKYDNPGTVVIKKVAQAVVIHYVSSEGINAS